MEKNEVVHQGRMIVVEGIDGSGKTTQIKNIADYLASKGLNVLTVREPGGTELGEDLRALFKTKRMTPLAELFVFCASRVELLQTKVIPHLKSGGVVVYDRFMESTMAYQGELHGLHKEARLLMDLITEKFKLKDFSASIFYLHIDAETSMQRCMKDKTRGGATDHHDALALEEKKRLLDSYTNMSPNYTEDIITIDARHGLDVIWQEIKNRLDTIFNLK